MAAESKTVTIPTEELAALTKGMKALQAKVTSLENGEGIPAKKNAKQVKERVAVVCFVNKRAVIGYVNKGIANKPIYVYESPNPRKPTDYMLFVDLVLDGQKDPVRVPYLEFLEQCEKHECLISNIRKEHWTDDSAGTVSKLEVPDGEYFMTDTGIVVPLEVRGDINFYTVTLPDDRSLELHERYININR